jgi:hypothetical protein
MVSRQDCKQAMKHAKPMNCCKEGSISNELAYVMIEEINFLRGKVAEVLIQ